MSQFKFSYLSTDHQDEILRLRLSEYKKYYGDKVDLKGLNWNKTDNQSIHLGLFESSTNQLISYLRLTGFISKNKLEITTLFETPNNIIMPVGLLTRAATTSSHGNFGLHSILRCRALEICLKNNLTTVLGTLETSASRLEPLKKLGYLVLSTKKDWGKDSYIKSESGVALIGLTDQQKITQAVHILREKYHLLPLNQEGPELIMI